MSFRAAEQLLFSTVFHPFSNVGNSERHSTFFVYFRFYSFSNLDEMPIPYEYLQGWTYNQVGKKTIWVKESRSGWDQSLATLVLCIFADGIPWVPPMVIFRGAGTWLGHERLRYYLKVLVEFNPTAYINDVLFEKYVRNHLIPVLGGHPTLFALDLMGSHKTRVLLNLFHHNNIIPSIIPARCTSLVQPLDVSVNKLFKGLMQDLTDERIFEWESLDEFEK